jgi:lipopolysaccharide export system protein LptA
MNTRRHSLPVPLSMPILVATLGLSAAPVWADRSDRDKPVNLEANRITIDEGKKVQILEGNVVLVQGTLTIRAEKLVVTQDANGFQKGVAYSGAGRLATFRQKREGKDEYIDGEAERIEYDSKADKAELFDKAYIKSGLDEVQGQYISYDAKTENYLVTGGSPAAGAGKGGRQERVRAVIQPKNRDAGKPSGTSGATAPPKPVTGIDAAKQGE